MKRLLLLPLIIGILFSCSHENINPDNLEVVPGDLFVGIKSGTNAKDVFDLINKTNLKVDRMEPLNLVSLLPSSSLDYVIDFINKKPYAGDGKDWIPTGFLHYQTQQIHINLKMFGMDNKRYQQDWLNTINEMKLEQKINPESIGWTIHFKAPKGKEVKWVKKMMKYKIVEWAEPNYYLKIEF